jgi:hypothetical protein
MKEPSFGPECPAFAGAANSLPGAPKVVDAFGGRSLHAGNRAEAPIGFFLRKPWLLFPLPCARKRADSVTIAEVRTGVDAPCQSHGAR